ncbi:uncharacterized protein PG998_004175 [Apiospora kogelbergensis]|uniref:uncharacterized protein n=1 Tax=Apiospora kogelbergensis TaxID=1337665 RepID=UPI00312F4757
MLRVTTFNASAQAPRRPYTNGVPWKQGDPTPAGLPMPEDLRARIEQCKTRNQKKGPLEFPKITFNDCVPTFPFLNGAYQVHWECTPGLVPVSATPYLLLLPKPSYVEEEEYADFKTVLPSIRGNTRATKTMMRIGKTRTGIKTYEKDDVHFTTTLTDDLNRIQVSGYIYTTGDNNLIPSDIVKSRVVYGNAKPGIDLNHCIRTAMRR